MRNYWVLGCSSSTPQACRLRREQWRFPYLRYFSCFFPSATTPAAAEAGKGGLVTKAGAFSASGFRIPVSRKYCRNFRLLPLFSLTLKVASKVTLDPLQLVRVQLARAECLAEAGFPAEAASALAGVLSGKSTPKTTGGYAGRR